MKRVEPGIGQESVWDYPRPPRLERFSRPLRIVFAETTIVDTSRSYRVLETSHPPVYYLPKDQILPGALVPSKRVTFCEWKGVARFFHVTVNGITTDHAAWAYDQPNSAFEPIHDHVAFYAHLMDACYVDGERVQAQAGGFYGGWITQNIVGPFKGEPGTRGW